jgi:acyl-CoA synthetase (AMP-forming)/AMP-acid ligase II
VTRGAPNPEPFVALDDLLRAHGVARGDAVALVDEDGALTWREFNILLDRVAAAFERDGVQKGDAIAIVAGNSNNALLSFLGALRAGAVPAPLTSSAAANTILLMLADSGSRFLMVGHDVAVRLVDVPIPSEITRIALDAGSDGISFRQWLAPEGANPVSCDVEPDDAFNIIYSSGTTGAPKGIVQSHRMRQEYARRMLANGTDATSVSIASTPLYSNTTLVALLPTLAAGGKVVLMKKFDAGRFLALSERERVTDAMLVPVQYRRIMEHPGFDGFDLSAYRVKTSTSAPFPAWLKADVVNRWPGALIDRYGMTEGGGGTSLHAHLFPAKLHTVGQVNPGHIIKIIDETGAELPQGSIGEIVGHSPSMMTGYLGQPDRTREAEWFDSDGRRYIRHGDVGRFDEDGFLILLDRTKDLIISGGFNIYPADLEAELVRHPAVREAAVIGMACDRWGETPLGIIVLADTAADPAGILADANSRLGRTQRLAAIEVVDELPRSPIGKVLKRALRDRFAGSDA